MTDTLTIEGAHIIDIPTLYAEFNRVFMAGETWTLGASLDALDDMLRGGYGALAGRPLTRIVWRDIQGSKVALGRETTRTMLLAKLQRPDLFNTALIAGQLNALERGTGKTYFDTVIEIFADHPNVELVLA